MSVTFAQESFIKAQVWVKELQRQGKADVVIALAGNKTDLEERRDVTRLVRVDHCLNLSSVDVEEVISSTKTQITD